MKVRAGMSERSEGTSSEYVVAYQGTWRRYAESGGVTGSGEWMKERAAILAGWKCAVDGLLSQADRDDPEIWGTLGEAFSSGFGTERDEVRAEEFLRKAANAGRVESMIRLGTFLGRDWRSGDDRAESIEWFRRAADHGNASAMTTLGMAYRDGREVTADINQAVRWFLRAYEAGSANAAGLAGRLLAENPATHAEAVKWLRLAVEGGCKDYHQSLAVLFDDRSSPVHDPREGFLAWVQVAQRPSGEVRLQAMRQIALCCRDGLGTERSVKEAKRWLDRLITLAPTGKPDHRRALKLRAELDEELF
jgi:TPR repeat protein